MEKVSKLLRWVSWIGLFFFLLVFSTPSGLAFLNVLDPATGEAFLHVAAKKNNILGMEVAIERGANPILQSTETKETPLHICGRLGQVECVKILIKKRGLNELEDKWGFTPLLATAIAWESAILNESDTQDYLKIAKLLVAAGANFTFEEPRSRATPFLFFVKVGDESLLKMIKSKAGLNYPLLINHSIKDGPSALHMAVLYNQDRVVESFLKEPQFDRRFINGVSIIKKQDGTKVKRSPLLSAIVNNNLKIVKLLVGNGADLFFENEQDRQNENEESLETPFRLAMKLQHWKIATYLAELYIQKVEEGKIKNLLPLHDFIRLQNIPVEGVRSLIEAGADVNEFDENKSTPLHIAVRGKNGEYIRTLLKAGAYVNLVDFEGRVPLHLAAKYGNEEAVRLLLEGGTDEMNRRDDKGRTPLHYVARFANGDQRFMDVFNLLLKYGADVFLKTKGGIAVKNLFVWRQSNLCFHLYPDLYRQLLLFSIRVDEFQEKRHVRYQEPQRVIQQVAELQESKVCLVCMEKEKTHLFYPCAHKAVCEDCAEPMKKRQRCPVCRTKFINIVKVFE